MRNPFGRQAPPLPSRRARIQRPGALTASAVSANAAESSQLRRLSQPWQGQALARYDDVGECWYPAQFYSRTIQKVRFFAAFLDEKGDPQEQESGPLADLWDRVQDPGGGHTELTGSYGHLMFLTGDGYLVASEDDGEEVWEYLSPLELRINPSTSGRQTYRRLRAPGVTPQELIEAPDNAFEPMGDEARVWRMFRRHPAYSSWADSPVRSVLDLYELLRMLTLAANAEAQSRAANRGLLYVPDDLSFGSADDSLGDEDAQIDPVLQELIEAASAAIRDPGSASAMAPLVMRGPGFVQTGMGTQIPMADAIKWMPLGPDDSYRATEAWAKVIERIAYGLDLPAEMVTGAGSANHWGGWLLDEQGFRQHVAPVVEKFCSDMTTAYLRPAAKAANIANWENVAIGYDPAEAVNHPDEAQTAQDFHDRLVISDEALREAGGFSDQDAPDDAELERRTLVKINVDPYAEPMPAGAQGETAPQDGGNGNDTAEAPPEQNGNGAVAASALVAAKILGASEAHVNRIRALAGSRVKNRSQGCPECQEKIRGLTASAIPSALGAAIVRTVIEGRATEADLVAGGGDELAETLRRWGVEGEWPAQLARLVEQHTQRTLYEADPPPLPAGFSSVVKRAIAA